jgi:hypothetical protein
MSALQPMLGGVFKSLFRISGCAGWTGIFSSNKEKSGEILGVFRAFLTQLGRKKARLDGAPGDLE